MFDSLIIEAFDSTGLHLVADSNGLIIAYSKNHVYSALYSLAACCKILYSDNGHYYISYKEHKWLTSPEIIALIAQFSAGTYDLHLPVWQSDVEKRK